jgi:hypothetical protein
MSWNFSRWGGASMSFEPSTKAAGWASHVGTRTTGSRGVPGNARPLRRRTRRTTVPAGIVSSSWCVRSPIRNPTPARDHAVAVALPAHVPAEKAHNEEKERQ